MPPELEYVINRALEKERELRYQHASELRTELRRLKRKTNASQYASASSAVVAPERGDSAQSDTPSLARQNQPQ
jgi:hypothetical protein